MRRKLVLGLAALGIGSVLAISLPLYGRLFGRKRLRFPYLSRPIPAATYAALAERPGWSKAEISVTDGLTLRGLVRPPRTKGKPWVLFYPGNDESQLERGQAFLARVGADSDLGLAVFAYRGYDASDGKSELAGIRADAPLILQRLCELQGIQPAQVHLVGFSIGGYVAVQAARDAAVRGQRAATLSLLASVDDIVMYQPSRFEKLSAGEDYQTRPFLDKVPAPVLVLQGAADLTLDGASQGRAIAEALGERAKYVEFAGVGHVALLEEAGAVRALADFVDANA